MVHDGRLATLRRFKDDVREVATGYECGLTLENYQDVKVGDVVEAYEVEQVARRLGPAAAKGAQAAERSRLTPRRVLGTGAGEWWSACCVSSFCSPRTIRSKGKRSVLRTIKARVQNKFNVSIAECDDHDLWQRATLGVSQVGADQIHVDQCLREVMTLRR